MGNRILVLGATGTIGSFLVQELRRRDADFVAGVPQRDMAKVNNIGVEGTVADFDGPASLDAAMEGIDSLFLLLPMAPKMAEWASSAVSAARKRRVSFILRSSLIDSSPDSPYFLFKVHGIIDRAVRESGIPYAIVRPNSFMQNFVTYYAGSINSSNASFSSSHDSPVSYIDVRDIAAVDACILTGPSRHRNADYTVTGPDAVSNSCIARILSEAAARQIEFVRVSREKYGEMMRGTDFSGFARNALLSLEDHAGDGKQAVVTDDVARVTGHAPRRFKQFAEDYRKTWEKTSAAVS